MKNKYLGIICLIYSTLITYITITNKLKNFLAPNMQIYIKISLIPLTLIGILLLLNKNTKHHFKISDLILLLPIIALITAGDGKLTTSLASNRTIYNQTTREKTKSEPETKIEEKTEKKIIEKIDFEIVDENYTELASYLTYAPKAIYQEGKTIRVRGFILKKADYLPDGYFSIGKYAITCCAADAGFLGFIVKYDNYKIKDDGWYEIEGTLEQAKDKADYDIMAIKILNIKEIDSKEEEQYVYPCYSYGKGECKEVMKYNLEY